MDTRRRNHTLPAERWLAFSTIIKRWDIDRQEKIIHKVPLDNPISGHLSELGFRQLCLIGSFKSVSSST